MVRAASFGLPTSLSNRASSVRPKSGVGLASVTLVAGGVVDVVVRGDVAVGVVGFGWEPSFPHSRRVAAAAGPPSGSAGR